MAALEFRLEGKPSRLVARQADHHHVVRVRGEDRSLVLRIADAVTHAGQAAIHPECAAVVRCFLVAGESEVQVAQRLVSLLVAGDAHHVLVGQFSRLGELFLADQFADLREALVCLRVVVVVRTAGPERVLIEQNAFRLHAAEDHPAETAVADRHRVAPCFRRLTVPKRPAILVIQRAVDVRVQAGFVVRRKRRATGRKQ